MTSPISSFSKRSFETSRSSYAIGEDLGVPVLAKYNDRRSNNETILIPCFHPGYLQFASMSFLKNKTQGIFAMVLTIAWHATYLAAKIAITEPALSRKQLCTRVISTMKTKLQPNEVFGRASGKAKQIFMDAHAIYQNGRQIRTKAAELPQVPTGILPTVLEHIRQGRYMAGATLEGGLGGSEVTFQSVEVPGPQQDNIRVSLRWKDTSDGEDWHIRPVLLPVDVVTKNKIYKRRKSTF